MKVRIVLVEDHQVVREGLAALLRREPGFEVVGEAGNGQAGVEVAERLAPDVVVMDIGLPVLNGVDATRRIVKRRPGTRVIGLSMHAEEHFETEMFRAGASGYLLKDCAGRELVRAIRTVMEGGSWAGGQPGAPPARDADGKPATGESVLLSPREREVLQRLAEGRTVKEIASELELSPKTVETYRAALMRKLEARNVADLTHHAIRMGLTPLRGK